VGARLASGCCRSRRRRCWTWRLALADLFDDVDNAVMMKALAATSVGSLPALAPWSVGHLHGKRQEEIV